MKSLMSGWVECTTCYMQLLLSSACVVVESRCLNTATKGLVSSVQSGLSCWMAVHLGAVQLCGAGSVNPLVGSEVCARSRSSTWEV